MLFSSITFLYYFLPVVLLLYYVMPRRMKNGILLLTSVLFYAWGGVSFAVLMLVMISVGYFFGKMIEKYRETSVGKWICILAVAVNVAMLMHFKFAEVFPIGISFYTFQIISYLIDVYRGEVAAQQRLSTFATYAALFPQLVAGPIVRYADVEGQLSDRTHDLEKIAYGIRRFIIGLAKKVLIANSFGELCGIIQSSNEKSVLFYWMYAVAFTLQIYYDFSGYSDMAIGLGKLFGFTFAENFNYPYISRSITEFWRRWHISLGSWFRDYVYIPLGGNRVPKWRWMFNVFIVWFLTGFWHGAAFQFIVWGMLFAILLLIEKLWISEFLEKHKLFAHLYVVLVVVVGFVIFNSANLAEAFTYISGMAGVGNVEIITAEAIYYLRSYAILFVIAMVGATPFPKKLAEKVHGKCFLEPVILIGLLLVVTAYLVDGSFNPFLYFRF